MPPKKKAAAKTAVAASPAAGKKTDAVSPSRKSQQEAAVASPSSSKKAPAAASPSPATKAPEVAAPAASSAEPKKARRVRQPIDVVLADNPSPAAIGVVASALSHDEGRLVTARSNGSLALYRVLAHKRAGGPAKRRRGKNAAEAEGEDASASPSRPAKKIFNFVMTASTGGRPDAVATAMTFLGAKDDLVLVAYGSGAFVLYDAVALTPLCAARRVGGVARAVARAGKLDFFAAVSDGSVRRWQVIKDAANASFELRMVQTIPKAVGCERALCVAVSRDLGCVFVGDDSRAVTAWDLRAIDDLRTATQQWSVQLPNSFPLALAVDGAALAVGTSMNEVVFVDPRAGIIVNTFEHHKGPVTVLTAAAGVFYATGWHDSVRAYRASADEGESVAQRGRRRERDAVNNVSAADRVTAGDYAPAEVKRRTHYHEVTSINVGVKSGLFLSTARDGTILFSNLERFFSSPASYLDSQVSVTPHSLVGGDLLFTHRDNTVEVHRVLPHALLPLVNYSLEGGENVRGVWPNAEGTRAVVATDARATVLAIDVNRETNVVGMQRLVHSPVPAVTAACFADDDTALVASGSAMLVLRCDAETTAAATAAGRAGFAKKSSRSDDAPTRVEAAAALSCVSQCFTHDAIEGTIVAAIAPSEGANSHVFIATHQPSAVHWLAMSPDVAGAIKGVGFSETLDSVSHAPLRSERKDAVTFLNTADSRHYACVRPGTSGKKLVAVTTAEAPLPLAATIHGRSTPLDGPGANPNAPYVASFTNGLVDVRTGAERWRYTRPGDREKAAPNDVKTRFEFGAFAPKAAAAPWTSSSAELVKELEAMRKRAAAKKKKHRGERATIALEGEASDQEGSDDEAVLEAHVEARKAAEARGESGAVDAAFALRRNVPALVQALPLAWRVRRFGN